MSAIGDTRRYLSLDTTSINSGMRNRTFINMKGKNWEIGGSRSIVAVALIVGILGMSSLFVQPNSAYARTVSCGPFPFSISCSDDDADDLLWRDETKIGTDPNNPDTDGDGLNDGYEYYRSHTNPLKADTDSDGLRDNDELLYGTNPLKADTDRDGLGDGVEIRIGTDPLKKDTDGDSLNDGIEVNKYHTDPLVPDTDGDGLSDWYEVVFYHTNPLAQDTDSDGLTDGYEIDISGTNPLSYDTDEDTISDFIDNCALTANPFQSDIDSDSLGDACDPDSYAPVITAISNSPDPFSPNGDQFEDVTTISFTSDESGTYAITITDANNQFVLTLSGSMFAGTNDIIWEGKDSVGNIVPNGAYHYFIEASDGEGHVRPNPINADGSSTVSNP
jgi:flagellar hook capping protein FlgD/thrombospondin type 3 repeat protein